MKTVNQLEMLALPETSGAVATKTSLTLAEKTRIDQWAKIGAALYHGAEKMRWWLADWAAFGDQKYGELKQFCELNDINYGTIANLAAVARAVESSRRRELLSFSHHVEVAPLSPKLQKKFLKLAEAEKLSVADLRAAIRKAGAEFGPEKTYGPPEPMFAVAKFFLDADVFLERNLPTVKQEREYLWDKVLPVLEKAAKIWPEKLTLK